MLCQLIYLTHLNLYILKNTRNNHIFNGIKFYHKLKIILIFFIF